MIRLTQWAAPIAAIACFGLGALLRCYDFDSYPMWIDEYGTYWVVAAENITGVWQRALTVQGQSPLYYLVVRVFVDVLGASSLAMRLPSLLAGLGLLAAGYFTALRLFADRRVALASLAALAFNERLVFYSQDARPYALALLCACLSFCFYARMLNDRRRRIYAAWLLFSAATYYLHYLFGIALLAQLLHWVLRRSRRRQQLLADVSRFGLLAALMLPGATQLTALHARRHMLDWVQPSEDSWVALRLGLSLFDLKILGPLIVGLLLALLWERPRSLRLSRSGLAISTLWLAVPVIVIFLGSAGLSVNLLNVRYIAVAIPAAAMFYGGVVGIPSSPRFAAGLLVILVTAGAVQGVLPLLKGEGAFRSKSTKKWFRNQYWRSATQQLVEQAREGELVLYGTMFVESDAVILGEASSQTEEFVSWPVRAHLPAEPSFRMQALPYWRTPETLQALTLEMQRAGTRVWIIGLPGAIQPLLAPVERGLGLKVRNHRRFGNVQLIALGFDPAS